MMDNDNRTEPDQECCPQDSPDACKACRGMAGHRMMNSEELLQGGRELLILHGGQVYRLLRTRNDKLILQK